MRRLLAFSLAFAQDPREIFRRSVEKDQVNRALRQQYTFMEKSVEKELDKNVCWFSVKWRAGVPR
jgi:hypothetical protein